MPDAIDAHDEALSYGGRAGIVSLPLIQSAIARPYMGYYRTISAKAAALVHSVVNNHGFVDGNKRTALILVGILIERSGQVPIIADTERFDDLIVAVAEGSVGFADLELWFSDRIVRKGR